MSQHARQVFDEALGLPLDERADLATELLRSLDDDDHQLSHDEVEQRWAAELTRRAERAHRGESTGRDAEAALREIEAKLRRR